MTGYGCEDCKTKLSALSLGIAFGVVTALYMMFFAWVSWYWGYGVAIINQFSSIYIGYASSFMGGIVGAFWGFVDGFIFGILSGWIYNLCLCCRCKKSSTVETENTSKQGDE